MTRHFLLLFLLLLAVIPTLAQMPPDPFQAHLQAGQTALRAGLPLVAVREYRAAVHLRPADADAHYTLASVLEAAGRADEAMAEYRQTIALRPDNAPAHNALAGLLEDRGESEAALAHYREAAALLPSDPRLHFNLGGALEEAGRRDQAAAQYQEALRLKPDFAEAAQALRALGPSGGAAGSRFIAPSSSISPVSKRGEMKKGTMNRAPTMLTPASSRLSSALALTRAGLLPQAIAAFRTVLVHSPRDAAARLYFGIVLYADGQTGQARREWEQVRAAGAPGAATQARRLLARYP